MLCERYNSGPRRDAGPAMQASLGQVNRRSVLVLAAVRPNFDKGPTDRGAHRKPRRGTSPAQRGAGRVTGTANVQRDAPSGKQRLSKVLAAAGVASRRACEDLIAQGVVKVNNKAVLSQVLVDPAVDKISVNGTAIKSAQFNERLYHFVVNKPKGYICSSAVSEDKPGMRVIDLLQPWVDIWRKDPKHKGLLPPRFFTVGRLDVASTGLLFVTNDGQWAQAVSHPSSNLTKEYLVLLDKAPSHAQGVDIDGVRVQPEEVSSLEEAVRLRIVVSEGKTHEVRLLVAAAGLEVLALKRVRIGGYRMPRSLRLGECMLLKPADIKKATDPKAELAERQAAAPPASSPSAKELLRKAGVATKAKIPVKVRVWSRPEADGQRLKARGTVVVKKATDPKAKLAERQAAAPPSSPPSAKALLREAGVPPKAETLVRARVWRSVPDGQRLKARG
ncbi:S4 RNA-binding domain-containing protein [Haematococcus lacustris]|uniref:S4 RNA-binding domain-containing protein n=1 Tax=Haematococcus lacustris TaxID=44745 RepID=A0A699YVU7_HAELA|nr:S4 RNA-binding domain-containing protein [Haematococcus lacustris]